MELAALVLLLPFLLAGFLYLRKKDHGDDARRLPPSPRGLPVIGNLHQVGALPHRGLSALAAAHGAPDLLLLRLGRVPALVASSPAAAAELLRSQDHAFATRPYFRTAEILSYGFRDLVFAPHGEHWRHVRRICSSHVLSAARSHRQNAMREREVAALVKAVAAEASTATAVVDVSGALYWFANDVICRVVCGRLSWEEEEGRRELLRELIEESSALLSGFRVGDYFPALAWADAMLPGGGARAWKNIRRWDVLLEKVLQEHERRRAGLGRGCDDDDREEDFVDVLLALQEEGGHDGFNLTRDIVKALLGDIFVAGTETTYSTLEWAMSELIKNPTTMRKLQHEVRSATQSGGIAGADTLGAAPYLKAVVKEALRLHPPAPLLLPRECMQDSTVLGYHVAKGTRVFVNAWAICRDPASWHAPDEFRPERFLESDVDFRGRHFQFIPFGAGRRICPGMQFSLATMELALANLVRMFDWELPDGMSPWELDMSDSPGLVTARRVGLRLVARPFVWGKQE